MTKRSILGLISVLFVSVAYSQNKSLGVGTATPSPNAALHVESPTSNQGAILPRLTTAQRTATAFVSALTSADNGLIVYDTDLSTLFIWDGASWKTTADVAGGAKLVTPYVDTVLSAPNNSNLLRLVYSGSATENVGVAHFENLNPNSGFSAIFGRTNSATNGVADFILDNPANDNDGISVVSNGVGRGGAFTINNIASQSYAVYGQSNGDSLSAAVHGNNVGNGFGVFGKSAGAKFGSSAVYGEHVGTGDAAGAFRINNPANPYSALYGETNGNGAAVRALNLGGGNGAYFRKNGATPVSAAMWADNFGDGGYGAIIQNISPTNANAALFVEAVGPGPSVWANKESTETGTSIEGLHSGTEGHAARFVSSNAGNTWAAVQAESQGTGPALLAVTNTAFTAVIGENGGSGTGVFGRTTGSGVAVAAEANGAWTSVHGNQLGTNGHSGYFSIDNAANVSTSLVGITNGSGDAGFFEINNATSTNAAVKGRVSNTGGTAGAFEVFNASNPNAALNAITQGIGPAANFTIDNASSTVAAVNIGTNGLNSAMYVTQDGSSDAVGASFNNTNAGNSFPAIQASTQGSGTGIRVIQSSTSVGGGMDVYLQNPSSTAAGFAVGHDGQGSGININLNNAANTSPALNASTSGTGHAANFAINEATNAVAALNAFTLGSGPVMIVNQNGAQGNDVAIFQANNANVARIDKAGQGFFNGGTVNSGADLAEMFDVEGSKDSYEPGDVLVISQSTDRTVQKSSAPNSTRVAGVYATKPGVMLTEKTVNESIDDLVPMGVVGVIPTKVCLEQGSIKRGDLLVTSSKEGHAMKAVPVIINGVEIYPTGAILGKALENFDGSTGSTGLIKVLVNVK